MTSAEAATRLKAVVFGVEQPGRLVGAFDVAPELIEIPRLVAVEGAFGDTGKALAGLLDLAQEPAEIARRQLARLDRLQPVVEDVECTHISVETSGRSVRAFSRALPIAARIEVGIAGVGQIEADDVVGGGLQMPRRERRLVGVERDDRQPILGAAAITHIGFVDLEDARQIFGALDAAGEPEDAFGIAGEQRIIQAPTCLSTRLPARN